jgi:hypothetical protein
MLLVAAALLATAGGSSLASAQPNDHDDRGWRDRDRYRDHDRRDDRDDGRYFRYRDDGGRYFRYRDHDDRRFADRDDRWSHDRDDRRFYDRDNRRFYDRDDHRYLVGQRRWFNGYYWTWDGDRWCRRDKGVVLYFGF